MIVKPSIGFVESDNDAAFATNVETIITSMTKNSNYPTPSPSLAVITAGLNDYNTAVANAATGGTEATALKNAKRAALGALVRQLAAYVSVACKGDMAKLISSGFPIQKPTRTPAGILPAPAAPVLRLGKRSGDLVASTPPVTHAYTYNWRLALASAPTAYLKTPQSTGARFTFTGLTPGQIYVVSLNAVGSAGPSDWSSAVELMVV